MIETRPAVERRRLEHDPDDLRGEPEEPDPLADEHEERRSVPERDAARG